MATLIYRCPATGHNVQGWVADDPTASDPGVYETVTCIACTRVHLVNPTTGKVLAADDE
jgi:hypothetical protein